MNAPILSAPIVITPEQHTPSLAQFSECPGEVNIRGQAIFFPV